MILAIDPGPENSAWLAWDGKVRDKGVIHKSEFHTAFWKWSVMGPNPSLIAIEMVACYGMPVGKEVFETCLQIGRIMEICHPKPVRLVFRKDIKLHLCGSARAKDSNIRQALIDRVGPQGKKASPGPTYGLAKHDWAALAIALYVADNPA